jgi:hypothetical protein
MIGLPEDGTGLPIHKGLFYARSRKSATILREGPFRTETSYKTANFCVPQCVRTCQGKSLNASSLNLILFGDSSNSY